MDPFLRAYAIIRSAEGWGSADPSYYRELPRVSPRDPQRTIWKARSRALQTFERNALEPLEQASGRALRILDLGAGNCWLANRLAQRGHAVAAIDLSTSRSDGLGARVYYAGPGFDTFRADFDALPLNDGQADLVIFNASVHYAEDVAATLREARRVLAPGGRLVILDTPVYRDQRSGHHMRREKERQFAAEYGLAPTSSGEGYLTWERLKWLGKELGLELSSTSPVPRWRRLLQLARFYLRSGRESASFPVIVVRATSNPPARLRLTLARFVVWHRFRLFQRHRHGRLVLEQAGSQPIIVLPGVFNPHLFRTGAFLSRFAADQGVPRGSRVLDLGTGTGIGAIAAAALAERVVAVDLNPEAVRCARLNALLNRVEERIEVREGDLFAPVAGERFDVVLLNPPFFRGDPRNRFDLAWRSNDVVERFAAELADHLRPGGYALVVLSTDGDTPGFLAAFHARRLTVEVAASQTLLAETLTVYRLRPEEN